MGRMDDLSKAAMFVEVVRTGSFSGGAKALGVARSTASEQVAALEDNLGVRLLERTTRALRLTEEGKLVFDRLEHLIQGWEQAKGVLEGRRTDPTGTLRVTSAMGLTADLIAPVCAELLEAFEGLSIELAVDDRIRDLIGEGIDVAVRMAPLEDSSLICRKLGVTRSVIVAAPNFIDPPKPKKTLATLRAVDWVGHASINAAHIQLADAKGARHTIRPKYRARGTNSEAQLGLVAAGCGVALIPESLARPQIESGVVLPFAPGWTGRSIPIYVVYSRTSHVPPRVRHFVDHLAQRVENVSA
ncbi:MAG: LysR family transcriptional regulator [Myxococcota bacterium]